MPAYIKSHSIGTTVLYVHDHLIKAMGLPQVTCLNLLDLSAAFDTIDHSILLERLSFWFGITSTALSWIKFNMVNRSLYVNVRNINSSVLQLLYDFLPGSVLNCTSFLRLKHHYSQ
jgi:hypothetical protein